MLARRLAYEDENGFDVKIESATSQTIGAAIADVLGQHGALSAAEIADHIRATGRDINNRTVSFSLQALKKRGLVKSADGS